MEVPTSRDKKIQVLKCLPALLMSSCFFYLIVITAYATIQEKLTEYQIHYLSIFRQQFPV